MPILSLTSRVSMAIATRQLLSLILSTCSLSFILFPLPIVLAPPQALAQTIEDRKAEADRLHQQAVEQYQTGQWLAAVQSLQQALEIYRDIDDRVWEAITLTGIGVICSDSGQYGQALHYFQQALNITQEVNNRIGEGTILSNIGIVYVKLGQYLQALNYYQQSLTILQEVNHRTGESVTLNNIGEIYRILGQYSQSVDYYHQSLSIVEEADNQLGRGNIFTGLGSVYAELEQYQQALDYYQQSLVVWQEIGDIRRKGDTLHNIGFVYHNLRQYQQALDHYQQALVIAREIGDRLSQGVTLSNTGSTFFELGQLQPAEALLLDAVAIFDTLRQQDLSDADKISLFERQVAVYTGLQQVQIAQNRIEAALETSERGRARPFVSLLSQRLQTEAIANLPAPSVSEIQQTASAQNATLVQYSVISTTIGTPAIYIWVIPPTEDIAFRSVELNEENQQILSGALATVSEGNAVFRSDSTTISNLVSNVRPADRSASRDIEIEYDPNLASDSLKQLHQLLIEPIADLLPTNESDRIVFIPQGGLFLVPFAALQDANGDYLIENHTISIAPSIQVLDITQQQQNDERSPQNALIVGNPVMPQIWDSQTSTDVPLAPLPGSEREAEAIAQFLNTEAIIGAAATETAVVEQMPNAQIIHLATHGLLEYGIPSESGVLDVPGAIALTPDGNDDGLLTSAEILEMDLQAELVVLSACDTGRGRITGDGVVGLSRALISAGAPSVVVSLWSVPDAPTAELMIEFYRQLATQPDKAQALRQAMLTTMQQHPDPRAWAAFTLIGEE